MDKSRKKELLEEFGRIKTYMGVIQVKNEKNGKIFIQAVTNLKNKWLTIQMDLNNNMHVNAELQKDWAAFGPEAFSYEVLEEKDTQKVADKKLEAKIMEKDWLEILQPYGDQGYHKQIKS